MTAQPSRLLHAARTALSHLAAGDDPGQLLDAAARIVVDDVGFDRCIVFRVEGPELVAHAVCFGEQHAWAARTLAVGQTPEGRPQLDPGQIESEMARRRYVAIVSDAQTDPRTPRALVAETQTESYVAAPVVCQDRVVAFVHADHHFAGAPVVDADREMVGLFAAGLGLVLETVILRRHLRRLQGDVLGHADHLRDLASSAVRVDASLAPAGGVVGGSVDLTQGGTLRARLSAREREVMGLMVEGATNADIARRLVIAEGTAKAHVHRILRKLGAANRAEAVALWLRTS